MMRYHNAAGLAAKQTGPSVGQAKDAEAQLAREADALKQAHRAKVEQLAQQVASEVPAGPAPADQAAVASVLGEGDKIERTSQPVDLLGGDLEPTREKARAAMHAALDSIMDDLETGENYLGLQIDLVRFADKTNSIAYVNLVPVDLIGGTPARRIANPA